jgi:hypothetical protein
MDSKEKSSTLCLSSKDFFNSVVTDAFAHVRLQTYPFAQTYLVNMLEFYMSTDHFFDEFTSNGKRTRQTLAETFLKAANSEPVQRIELLKKLADRSLYISGFFGDSLQRKIVDVDYYVEMGEAAYAALADSVNEDIIAQVYKDFSQRFLQYMEALNYISSKSSVQSEENILRLYENYARTGSDVAREQLLAKGLIAVPLANIRQKKQ